MPGQTVYSCLSHDIIAHEMTHAVTHRLRRHFFNPSNEDVLAFHEGFADIVAIFQHFSFPAILREEIQQSQGDLKANTPLVNLAVQFGQATGGGSALRHRHRQARAGPVAKYVRAARTRFDTRGGSFRRAFSTLTRNEFGT